MTNIGLISALAGKEDEIYSDELNHASIIDGCRLSQARIRIFQHRDLDHLESLLRFSMATGRRLIVSDSVFSMDGDLAELPGLVDLAEKYDALLVLDEAHATGVLGSRGRGGCEHFADLGLMEQRQGSIDVAMGTLSKALGSFGGFVACSRSMSRVAVMARRRLRRDGDGHPPFSTLPIRPAQIGRDPNGIVVLSLARRMHLSHAAEVHP